MSEPQRVIRITVVSGKHEREYDLDAERVSLNDFYRTLNGATNTGGMFVVQDDACVLSVNLKNIEDIYAELV